MKNLYIEALYNKSYSKSIVSFSDYLNVFYSNINPCFFKDIFGLEVLLNSSKKGEKK